MKPERIWGGQRTPDRRFSMTGPRRALAAVTAVLALCAAASTTLADDRQQETTHKLEELKAKIRESEDRKQSLEAEQKSVTEALVTLQQQLVDAARQIQETEDRVTGLEDRVTGLKAETHAQEAQLDRRRGQLVVSLAAMQRLSRQPPALVFLRPEDSLTTIRSAALLSTIVPALRERADAIREDLTLLKELRSELEAERIRLKAALAGLEAQQQEMDQLVAARRHEREQLGTEAREEARRLAEYARQAKSLESLIAKLEAEYAERREMASHASRTLTKRPESGAPVDAAPKLRPQTPAAEPPPGRTFASVQGHLPMPARGRVVRTFGQPDDIGNKSKGIVIEARANAQVIAPHDGRIAFAGPFRDYGQILIISHGQGYHTLLAGMSRISAVVGQWVLAGEPVGVMGASGGSGSSKSRARLYVELRSNGKPVNPLLWLASGDGKVSG